MCVKCHPLYPSLLAAGSFNGEVIVWDVNSPESPIKISPIVVESHEDPVMSVDWVYDPTAGAFVVASLGADGKVRTFSSFSCHILSALCPLLSCLSVLCSPAPLPSLPHPSLLALLSSALFSVASVPSSPLLFSCSSGTWTNLSKSLPAELCFQNPKSPRSQSLSSFPLSLLLTLFHSQAHLSSSSWRHFLLLLLWTQHTASSMALGGSGGRSYRPHSSFSNP
jgi:WD40 repeat protein